ncbi:hypothetical protein ACFLRX_00505 [Acidobacteriota bacterium]
MKKRIAVFLVAIFVLTFGFSIANAHTNTNAKARIIVGQDAPSIQQSQGDRVEEEVETIVPAPKDIMEATAIYVFLGWIWLSIGVLIFFLRLKIKEVDRLYDLHYFSDDSD